VDEESERMLAEEEELSHTQTRTAWECRSLWPSTAVQVSVKVEFASHAKSSEWRQGQL
jgi:hypothetical protein